MTKEIEQGLHEKLCAFILGEASDEVRAEVERELAANAELREERERLEGTIGLVKGALGGGESLSRSPVEILARARMPRVRPWYARPSFRIAAGLTAAALAGLIAFRAVRARSGPRTDDLVVVMRSLHGKESSASGSDRAFEARANAPQESPLLAYGDEKRAGETAAGAGPSTVAPSAKSTSGVAGGSTGYAGPSDTTPASGALTVESLERVDALASANPGEMRFGETIAKQGASQETWSSRESSRRLREFGYAGERVDGADNAVGPGTPRASKSEWRPPGQEGQGRDADEFFLGAKLSSEAARGESPPARAPGSYSEGQRAAAGASGPTGGAAPAPVAGVAVGSGEAKDARLESGEAQIRAGLAGLGYVGRDDDDFVLGRGRSVLDEIRRCPPEERERWIEHECRRIVTRCRPFPNERPRDMFFRFWGDNAFELSALDPLSTFSVDVDTASYALARRYLNEGRIPEKAQIRTEEFVNYFKADVPAPTEATFAIHTDLTPSRFSSDRARWMVRVVVRGKEVAKEERKPLHLTFVVDTSGSMKENGRLELVKTAMRLLVGELDSRDSIAIVAFSSDARMILPMTSAGQRSVIESAIFPLSPDGSTNAAAGLLMGYTEALTKIDPSATNRVVLLSDGVANTGQTDQECITESVKLHREKGIYLNTIGVGMNNHNDALLEQLADKGDGVCSYVDGLDEARKAIVDRFTGAFETIARDVKVQVEFDPAQVERYRLLGYENRAIADKDFRNDKVDAGEVGAGHQVTALYEIERAANASEKPLATVRVRWKAPRNVNAPGANEEANEIARSVSVAQQTSFEGAGAGYRRAVIVAQFAEFLRRSVHARGDALEDLIAEAEKLEKESRDDEVLQLVALMRKSKQLILQALPPCDDLCRTIDAIRHNALLRCQAELLAQAGTSHGRRLKALGYIGEGAHERLERENAELEERIKELLRRKLE